MKFPLLSACLAAVTTVSTAALKEPVVVAREWARTIEQVRTAAVPTPTLTAQANALTATPLDRVISPVTFPPAKSLRNTPLYDAPSHRRLRKLPHDRPPGVMPWGYDDPSHRLVPLTPAGQN